MYETLTIFLKKFDAIENGESQSTLDEIVPEFMDAVSAFVDTHQDWELHSFSTILDIARDDFFVNNLFSLKLSALNGKTVVALILDSIKNCHTGDEVSMAPFEDGRIIKCLNRLKAIDDYLPNQQDVYVAHRHSSNHDEQLKMDQVCGCFSCCKTFRSSKIEDWYDDGHTACCPYCCIDSVIGESSGYEITEEFMLAMEDYWFGSKRKYK